MRRELEHMRAARAAAVASPHVVRDRGLPAMTAAALRDGP
jgi:hypothetical protein